MKSLLFLIPLLYFFFMPRADEIQPEQKLQLLVKQLQMVPEDDSLRELIIALSNTINPAPKIPEDAQQAFAAGDKLMNIANTPTDYLPAISSYEQALRIAPWWGDGYYKLSIAQKLAGQLDGAEKSLKLYLLTKQIDANAKKAQYRISTIDSKQAR